MTYIKSFQRYSNKPDVWHCIVPPPSVSSTSPLPSSLCVCTYIKFLLHDNFRLFLPFFFSHHLHFQLYFFRFFLLDVSSAAKSSHNQNCSNDSMDAKSKQKHRFHLNTLWSIWYGLVFTYLQGYLILSGTYRFLGKQQQITFFLQILSLVLYL